MRSLNKVGVTARATGMTVGSREGDKTRFGGVSGRQTGKTGRCDERS